jgi:DNA-directed RNA polymerase specialized sigma24 family protein
MAIRELPPDYRAPLVRGVEGLSTREAAKARELSGAAFRSRLHRARMTIRRRLYQHFADPAA